MHVRLACPTDEPALMALLARCSADTLYRRFHGVPGAIARQEMSRVSHPGNQHRSWVAVVDGVVRGTATLVAGPAGTAEVAVLVEDAWFRRGVGRRLAAALLCDAIRSGIEVLEAWVQPENVRARDFFRSLAPGARASFEDRELVVRIPVGSPFAARRLVAPGGAVVEPPEEHRVSLAAAS
jgi:N-acetylglutamate synthase-like GNAT family acetyltransferase